MKVLKQKISPLKKHKKILLALFLTIVLILFVSISPILWAKGYAEKGKNAESGKTYFSKFNLFNPEVIVFEVEDDFDLNAYFVKLERKDFFGWKVKSETFLSLAPDPESDESTLAQDNIDYIKRSIKEGSLTEGTNIDIDEVRAQDEQILQETIASTQDGTIVFDETAQSPNGQSYALELVLGSDKKRYLKVNGELIPGLKGVDYPVFSPDYKYVYFMMYQSYEPVDPDYHGDTYSMGNLYRLDLSTKKAEYFYQFASYAVFDLGVNNKYLLYTQGTGETGVINLETKELTVLFILETADDFGSAAEISFIDDSTAIVQSTSERGNVRNHNKFIINFADLSFREE